MRRYEQLECAFLSRGLKQLQPAEVRLLVHLLERVSVGLYSENRGGGGVCLRCGAHIAATCPVGGIHGGCPYQRARHGQSSKRPRPAPTSRG